MQKPLTPSNLLAERFLSLLWFSLLACSSNVSLPPTPTVKEPDSSPSPLYKASKVYPDVIPVHPSCERGANETCNGLDDNCDGAIDDGCGYQTGAVQITISWNSGADIDLYVTDPSGERVFFRKDRRRSKTGAHMDHDARGDCRKKQKNNRIENIYWEGSEPPKGDYEVDLHYFGPCDKSGETDVTVSISIGGEVVWVYRRTMQPEEKAAVVSFTIP